MHNLTPEGVRLVNDIAARQGFSFEAALTLLGALRDGHGSQAQFNHPELGGMGQWSPGMMMIGDMFNQGLKARVDGLCNELANLLRLQPDATFQAQQQSQGGGGNVSLFVAGSNGSWWPAELGAPASVGTQNDLRYAYFPAARRLAIQQGGQVRVYDSGEHAISGFSQSQSGDQTLTFSSQFGVVRLAELPLVSPRVEPLPVSAPPKAEPPPPAAAPWAPPTGGQVAGEAIFAAIERLAELRQKNILTEDEFAAKKCDLLSRL